MKKLNILTLALSLLLVNMLSFVNVKAIDEVEISDFENLKSEIQKGGEQIIVLKNDIIFSEQIVLPANSNITIKDDGNVRTMFFNNSDIDYVWKEESDSVDARDISREGMFLIPKESTLILDGTSNENLVFDAKEKDGYDLSRQFNIVDGIYLTVIGNVHIKHASFINTFIKEDKSAPIFVKNNGNLVIDDILMKDNFFMYHSYDAPPSNPYTVSMPSKYITQLSAQANAIVVEGGGKAVMNNGKISNNNASMIQDLFRPGAITLYGEGSKFTVNGGVFEYNQSFNGSVFNVVHGAELVINGGEFKNNLAYNSGGVIFAYGSLFDMTKASETDYFNAIVGTNKGAGPKSYENLVPANKISKVTINGGVFEKNHTFYNKTLCYGNLESTGGVLTALWNTEINITGGSFIENDSANGGAIAIYDYWRKGTGIFPNTINEIISMGTEGVCRTDVNDLFTVHGNYASSILNDDPEFSLLAKKLGFDIKDYNSVPWKITANINGGEFKNNKASSTGGAIYAGIKELNINKGLFEGNNSERFGGAIYVSSVPYSMNLKNVYMENNQASNNIDIENLHWSYDNQNSNFKNGTGGSIWHGLTGNLEIYSSNGGAIFDNRANRGGDDIVSVTKQHVSTTSDPDTNNKNFFVRISDRMLGGGLIKWYQDGSAIGEDVNRYSVNNLPILNINNRKDEVVLKSKADFNEDKNLAKLNAGVVFINNRAARGGAVATNGTLIIGEKDKKFDLKIIKNWDEKLSKIKDKDDTSVTVELYNVTNDNKEFLIDELVLNKKNNYQGTFKNLPLEANDKKIIYKIKEKEGIYNVSYDNTTIDTNNVNNNQEIIINILNKPKDTPSIPDRPIIPDIPTAPNNSPVDNPTKDKVPDTGINSAINTFTFILISVGNLLLLKK